MASGTSHTHRLTWLPAFLDEVQSEARLYNFLVEINKDHPDEDKDVLHSELGTAREAATLTRVWQRLPDRPGTEGSPRVAKREGSVCSRNYACSAQEAADTNARDYQQAPWQILVDRQALMPQPSPRAGRSLRFPLEIPRCFPSQEFLLHFRPGSFIVAISQLERMKPGPQTARSQTRIQPHADFTAGKDEARSPDGEKPNQDSAPHGFHSWKG
ncbi:uncharacterized protein LOC116580734 [Mustela erminea]|uniref:uncharacterized protein LOC116580734 n=1 Tax=Mustela erminea TaxID=36723 RepID=UPI001386D59A|nr:uncharacterized protein LOC116580734 [Mustela erminea]